VIRLTLLDLGLFYSNNMTKTKSKLLTIQFPPLIAERLDRVSKKSKASVNDLIIEAVESTLENLEEIFCGLPTSTYPRTTKGVVIPKSHCIEGKAAR
jgi:predicted DNA-binding protein